MAAFIKSKLSLTGTALWTSGPEKITLYPRYLDEPEVECPVEEPSSSTGSLFRVALQIGKGRESNPIPQQCTEPYWRHPGERCPSHIFCGLNNAATSRTTEPCPWSMEEGRTRELLRLLSSEDRAIAEQERP